MKLLQWGVVLVLLIIFILVSEIVLVYEQDKIYKIIVLYINDYYGYFWCNEYGEYGLAV